MALFNRTRPKHGGKCQADRSSRMPSRARQKPNWPRPPRYSRRSPLMSAAIPHPASENPSASTCSGTVAGAGGTVDQAMPVAKSEIKNLIFALAEDDGRARIRHGGTALSAAGSWPIWREILRASFEPTCAVAREIAFASSQKQAAMVGRASVSRPGAAVSSDRKGEFRSSRHIDRHGDGPSATAVRSRVRLWACRRNIGGSHGASLRLENAIADHADDDGDAEQVAAPDSTISSARAPRCARRPDQVGFRSQVADRTWHSRRNAARKW